MLNIQEINDYYGIIYVEIYVQLSSLRKFTRCLHKKCKKYQCFETTTVLQMNTKYQIVSYSKLFQEASTLIVE